MAQVQTQPPPQLPSYKSFEKVRSIPIINDSVSYAHSTFSSHPIIGYFYNAYIGLGNTAFEYSKPVQARFAPIIDRADDFALKGLDAVESRFPYPFQTPTGEIVNQLKSSSDAAYAAFHDNVQAPAYGVAKNADQSLSPIVDKLELAVNKIVPPQQNSTTTGADAGGGTQVGRAYRLSLDLKDRVYTLSGEHLRLVQQHNVVVQKATEAVQILNFSLSALRADASTKVNSISQSILSELEKVQHSAAALPSHIQSSLQPLQAQLSSTLSALSSILQSERTTGQKASEVASTVQKDVGPVLEAFKESAAKMLRTPKEQVTEVGEGGVAPTAPSQ
ncbi:uncharacterized protein EI90DRAFT_3281607 [Cantharellus anzutake]|uniref:uncharacterized protein n=1 Tax=Cantharellus anzutake TaxID=1750568 RepID=UPI00190310D5|nr:uncharacterized protein EI90DRAFT_3281607 [Cantharellus anzutake]KAF8326850.1 hypothetical protein EI90DRAFT_3281607 [Cantharellus anzutake]